MTNSSIQRVFTKPLPGRVQTCWCDHAGCRAAGGSSLKHEELSWVPGGGGNFRPAASLGLPGDRLQSALEYRRVGLWTSREMRTIEPSIDALMEHTEVQGSGDFCYRRHLGTRSPPRADSRGRRFRLISRRSGRPFRGCKLAEGSQSEIGSRQRGACWASIGEASRESRRRGSGEFFGRDFRAQPGKQHRLV